LQIKQINLLGGSVHVNAFEEALEELGVKEKAWTTIRKVHERRLLEAQDEVLLAYYGGLY
jgi:head-tail adaptor